MKRILYITLLIWLLHTSSSGSYWDTMDILYCTDGDSCWHEIAHRMDRELGYPSKSAAFGAAIRQYLYNEIRYNDFKDPFAVTVFGFSGMLQYSDLYAWHGLNKFSSPQQELYATLYAMAEGDISKLPVIFQSFYAVDNGYTELHDCLFTKVFCGTSILLERKP